MQTTTISSTEAAAALGAFLGGTFTFVLIAFLVWAVLSIIAGWKIFEKAGEAGWKILIPIYDMYILYKIVGMKTWFWVSLAVSLGVSLALGFTGYDYSQASTLSFSGDTLVPSLLIFGEAIFAFVIGVMLYYRLSKVFGHGIGYTLGLIFFSGIFMLILGFGRSKYDKKLAASWNK